MNTPKQLPTGWREAGFTLIEALIALVVVAFGMLAIAGFQMTLSRGADVAKQRSEAVRLAQEKMEQLRAFTAVETDATRLDYTADVVGSITPEVITAGSAYPGTTYTYLSNTNFQRSWSVKRSNGTTDAVGTDLQKWITVTVAWTDRAGASDSVTLRSVISRSDPTNMKMWTTNSASTTNRTPKNRDIDIPYPATDLGNGTSGFRPGGSSNIYFIFDNDTGEVTHRCTGTTVAVASTNCTNLTAYLVSGYIFYTESNISASDLTLTVGSGNNSLKTVKPLATTNPVGVQFIAPTASASAECFVEDQMVRASDNAIVAYDPTASSGQKNYAFTTYLCAITPVVVVSGETARWSGQFLITPGSSWTLGNGSSNYKLCRFSGDYDYDAAITNAEHPLYYRGVMGTLDNQNYVVVPGNVNCPSDTRAAPLTGKYVNNNTFTHQTELASGTALYHGGSLSIQSNQWDTATDEDATTTVELEMQ